MKGQLALPEDSTVTGEKVCGPWSWFTWHCNFSNSYGYLTSYHHAPSSKLRIISVNFYFMCSLIIYSIYAIALFFWDLATKHLLLPLYEVVLLYELLFITYSSECVLILQCGTGRNCDGAWGGIPNQRGWIKRSGDPNGGGRCGSHRQAYHREGCLKGLESWSILNE